MRFLCFVLLTVFSYNLSAQEIEQGCNTEDADSATVVNFRWYGNNEWLLNYVDSIEAPFACTNCRIAEGVNRTAFQIPVNAIVYENSGYPNLTNEEVEDYIASVNEVFRNNNVRIQFYIRCSDIRRRASSNHAKIDNFIEEQTVFMSDNDERCINLHFVSEADFSGSAKPPWSI